MLQTVVAVSQWQNILAIFAAEQVPESMPTVTHCTVLLSQLVSPCSHWQTTVCDNLVHQEIILLSCVVGTC